MFWYLKAGILKDGLVWVFTSIKNMYSQKVMFLELDFTKENEVTIVQLTISPLFMFQVK